MLDPEELAEIRADILEYLVDSCVVSDVGATDDTPIGGGSDGYGGSVRPTQNQTTGVISRQRNYPCRVTVPTSRNQQQENTDKSTSDTLTMAMITLPWDAEVYHTSKISVTDHETQKVTDYQVLTVEPHSESYSLRVNVNKTGL